MKIFKLTLLSALALAVSCSGGDFVREKNGIVVERGDMTIGLEVVNESIIHVTKSRAGVEVVELPDFVTVMEPQDVRWSASSRGGVTTLSTAKIDVAVDADGVIEYRDKSGKRLVAESCEATWIDPQGQPDVPVSQGFVAGDEAIYGLGQYQSGIMNFRAVPVHLDQYNQEIVIPFIVSTNGYGIYWHNYSITHFNRAEKRLPFEEFEVVNTPVVEDKTAKNVEQEDVANRKVAAVKSNKIRTITFTPEQSGLYTFYVKSDDKTRMRGDIRLSIDGDYVVNYSTIWMPTCYSGKKELVAGKSYEVTFQNDGASIAGEVYYNEPDFDKTTFGSTVGTAIDYYLVAGDSSEEIMYNYQDLTGRAPMFAKKAYGFWQCRERYHNQAELLENAREYRRRQIPVDYMIQDWHYWPEGTKGPEWDRERYPDPKAMTDELDDLNLDLMVSVWPTVTNPPLLKKYDLFESFLCKNPTSAGNNGYLDFYDERVQEGFCKMLIDSMFRFGVKSIWLDGSEPLNSVPLDAKTAAGEFRGVDNAYSMLVSKSVYEGRRAEYSDERVCNLTRSAFSGQQRYGVVSWSGDIAGTWEQFEEQISGGLNFSMAGVPYWTYDIGGFFRDAQGMNPVYDDQYTNVEYIELLSRWFQFGAFTPIFRIHGYKSETEVWRYGKDFEALARKYLDLRYALLPYIYSEAWRVTTESNLFITALGYKYPCDKRAWNIKDQYLFGESIMVAPVVEYLARTRSIYLPEGEWYNFWSGEKLSGGREVEVSAELDELPLFVKAGSIIPIGPKVQYADEPTDEPIRFKIYEGADAEFELYLDAGDNYEYEGGKYTILKVSYDDKSRSVTLESTYDQYTDFANNPQRFVVESLDGTKRTVNYSKGVVKVSL